MESLWQLVGRPLDCLNILVIMHVYTFVDQNTQLNVLELCLKGVV